VGVSQANPDKDLPDAGREAKPIRLSDEFPDLAYPPQIDKIALGQEVTLYVMVSATGRAEVIQVRQGSQSPAYDQWAENLMAQWEFEPAYQGGQPVAGELEVRLRIDPL
jgi:TonB family protein